MTREREKPERVITTSLSKKKGKTEGGREGERERDTCTCRRRKCLNQNYNSQGMHCGYFYFILQLQ